MNRTQQVLHQPITFTLTTTYIHTFAPAEWPIVTVAAAGQPMRAQILPIDFEGPIGNSNLSEVRVLSAERIDTERCFNTGYKMASSVQIPMLIVEGGYFL